jgi:predicted site-specific integrase-resolvase
VSQSEGRKLITVREARERLGISRVTMARLLREGRFSVYKNQLDMREKLIDEAELEEVRKPQLESQMGKAAGRVSALAA